MAKDKREQESSEPPVEAKAPASDLTRGFNDGLAGREPETYDTEYVDGYLRGQAIQKRRMK